MKGVTTVDGGKWIVDRKKHGKKKMRMAYGVKGIAKVSLAYHLRILALQNIRDDNVKHGLSLHHPLHFSILYALFSILFFAISFTL